MLRTCKFASSKKYASTKPTFHSNAEGTLHSLGCDGVGGPALVLPSIVKLEVFNDHLLAKAGYLCS